MSVSLDPITSHKVEHMLDHLHQEFDDKVEPDRIRRLLDDSVARLAPDSTVVDFLPLLAYRLTKERLLAMTRTKATATAIWDVVYVSLSGGGRGQLAAALTTHLSDGRVAVHSAGTAVSARVDPNVRAVIAEIGADPEDAYARPVTDEVLSATDVIVTMGHSVGVVEIPPGIRREDWRVGDPLGAPLAEVRRVRDDIEHRVRHLLGDLGVAA